MRFRLLSAFLFTLHVSGWVRVVNAQQQCKYEFTVPSTSGNCKVSDPDVHTKMSAIIDKIDKNRAQYVSRTSVVDEKLAKIETQLAKFNQKVAEVQRQMHHFAGQMTSGSGNQDMVALQKAISDTKDYFIKSVHNIENKLFNLSTVVKTDSVKDVRIRATLDAQIQKQADQIKNAMEKIAQMETTMKKVTSSGGVFTTLLPPPGGNSNTNSQSQIQHLTQTLETIIKEEETRHQQVKSEISGINASVHSLTSGMESLRSKSQDLAHRFEMAENHTSAVMGTVMQKLSQTQQELKQTATRITDLSLETKSLQSTLHSLTPSPVSGGVQTSQAELQSLKAQIGALESQTSAIKKAVLEQTDKITQMQKNVGALSPDVIAKLQTMAANTGTGSGSYATELKDLKNKVDGLVKQLVPSLEKKTTKHFAFAVPTLPPAGASRAPIVINPVGGNSYSYTFPPVRNIP